MWRGRDKENSGEIHGGGPPLNGDSQCVYAWKGQMKLCFFSVALEVSPRAQTRAAQAGVSGRHRKGEGKLWSKRPNKPGFLILVP